MIKTFEEYITEGIVKKGYADKSRARALLKEAETSHQILKVYIEKIGMNDTNANHIIKNAYDIIMELIRSRMLSDGYSSVGKGAHEAEVAYLRKMGFKEEEIEFADKLRYFRNGIIYYGRNYDKQYAEKIIKFIDKIYPKLENNK